MQIKITMEVPFSTYQIDEVKNNLIKFFAGRV